MWIKDKVPSESGYYMTYYFNTEHKDYFYKAIWWNATSKEWIFWKKFKQIPTIKAFIPISRNDYYVPCQINMEKIYKRIVKKIITPPGEIENISGDLDF